PGTMRWARQVFADELDRLEVVCEDLRVLDGRLDAMAERVGTSRAYLIRTYLTEDAVRSLARQVSTELTGRDVSLLQAARTVDHDFPAERAWPEEIRNYLIDHVSAGADAATYANKFVGDGLGGEGLGVEDLGLFRYRYRDPSNLIGQLGYGINDLVPVVTLQHRDLLDSRTGLRADPQWGRPRFEWAYQLVRAAYAKRTGVACDRMLWAWADLPTCLSADRPDLAAPGSLTQLSGVAPRDGVAVAARVPASRCLFTSHLLFDGLMLRGRYVPTDIDDALEVHRRFGTCHVDGRTSDKALQEVVIESWVQRLLLAPHD
ncbi:MAG: hypothetical protein M3256_18500, partial [Actinomycetota bacterium]|nr:hypothetical protein [Actinomycetota bacterium]